jgi:exodeoxyribonuclease V beta subunit
VIAWYPRPAELPAADERRLVVEASAGTGKTYFLEHRVVDRVLAGSAIDQILLVTFTDKATAELRARIRDLLGRVASATEAAPPDPAGGGWRIDDDARARLDAARTGFDRAAIHTIHGFCQRVLVEDAFAGRRLFEQQQIADEIAFGEAFRLALRESLAVEPGLRALLAAYLGTGDTVAKLEQLLLRCARAGTDVTLGPAPDPERAVDAFRGLRTELARLGPLGPGLAEFVTSTTLRLNGTKRKAIAKRAGDLGQALAELGAAEDWTAALAFASTWRKDLGYLADQRGEKGSEPVAGVLAAAAAMHAAAPSIEAACAIAFLPAIEARLIRRKARRGLFDYQDMLALVWGVLDGPRGDELAARLRARHPWAMIDEFQDTDPLQWKIFRRVWLDDRAPGGLTIVGDPKQAIYSFRGADVHTYLDAREEMRARGARFVELRANRRSSAPMIAALDRVFTGALGTPFFTGEIEFAQVVAAGGVAALGPDGAAPSPVHVFRLIAGEGGKPAQDAQKLALRARVADEVRAILHERPLTVVDEAHERRAPLRARDVFVLTRTNDEAKEVAAALRARGVPAAHRQAEHLFETDEAADVADLLDAVAAPRDRQRRLRAWTTAFFAVPLDELGALGDVPDGHPLVAMLHDWRGLAIARDYEALFARILDDTRLAERALVTGAGARTVANVLHVFELLQAEVARSRGELGELVAQLRRWIAAGEIDRPDESDVQRLDHDGDAVHVMTIHRAKGLEAPVVFVVGGGGNGGGKDRVHLYHEGGRRIAHVGDRDGDAKKAIDRETEEENQRLCYVALTRAKVRLYLWHGPNGRNAGGAYAPVHDALSRLLELGTPGITAEDVPVGAPARPAAGADDVAAIGGLLDGAWPRVEPAAPLGAHAGFRVTSYTQLAGEATDEVDVRADGEAADAPAVAPTELPAGAATGVFLHEILERVDFASAHGTTFGAWRARTDVEDVIAATARRHGVADPAHLDHARDIVWKTLTNEVAIAGATLPPLCRAAKIAREVEFAFPLPGGRGFAKGFIDLLVAWDDRVWVVDYKSNVLGELGLGAADGEVERSYRWQTRLYAIAAQRMLGAHDEDALASRFGGLVFWFLRPQLLVARRPTWAELDRWYASLAELPPQRRDL